MPGSDDAGVQEVERRWEQGPLLEDLLYGVIYGHLSGGLCAGGTFCARFVRKAVLC